MRNNRTALGRGLASLISSKPVSVIPPTPQVTNSQNAVTQLPVEKSSGFDGSAALKTNSNSIPALTERAHSDVAANSNDSSTPIEPISKTAIGTSIATEGVCYIDIAQLHANPNQPRKEFSEAELKELTDSIKTLGVLQPILVRALTENTNATSQRGFEIVAGERRYRAALRAGLTQVPVIIRHLSEREVVEIALVENIQRADLSPIEEAHGYNRLAEEFGLTQREIAERVGKDRATIANFLRLLTLPPSVLEMMRKGEITMGHAKAILTVREPSVQINLAKKIVSEGLSVRAIEAIVSRTVALPNSQPKNKDSAKQLTTITPEVAAVIDRLRSRLGTKVSVNHHVSGRGKIEVEYFSVAELERLMEVIGG